MNNAISCVLMFWYYCQLVMYYIVNIVQKVSRLVKVGKPSVAD